jgi:hypothetical protein
MSNIFASNKAMLIVNLLKEKAFKNLPKEEESKLINFLYAMCDREIKEWGSKEL